MRMGQSTAAQWVVRTRGGVLCTSTSFPGSMRPLFGLTQYLHRLSAAGGHGPRTRVEAVLLGSGGFDLGHVSRPIS